MFDFHDASMMMFVGMTFHYVLMTYHDIPWCLHDNPWCHDIPWCYHDIPLRFHDLPWHSVMLAWHSVMPWPIYINFHDVDFYDACMIMIPWWFRLSMMFTLLIFWFSMLSRIAYVFDTILPLLPCKLTRTCLPMLTRTCLPMLTR